MIRLSVQICEQGEKVIENNLSEISERLRNATPANWDIDHSFDNTCMYIHRTNEKPITNSDILFFENAATDIAKLVIEVKQLREINAALKRQLINQDIEKDLRFL
jgi:acetaldehyde dehydrogenase (acetylating)